MFKRDPVERLTALAQETSERKNKLEQNYDLNDLLALLRDIRPELQTKIDSLKDIMYVPEVGAYVSKLNKLIQRIDDAVQC